MSSYNDGVYATASLTGAKFTDVPKTESYPTQYTTDQSYIQTSGASYPSNAQYQSTTNNEQNTYTSGVKGYSSGITGYNVEGQTASSAQVGYSTGNRISGPTYGTSAPMYSYQNTGQNSRVTHESNSFGITGQNVVSQCAYGEAQETGEVRKISSVIVDQQYLGDRPQNTERIVEVPTVQEQIKYVPVKEVREIEKKVPVYDVEYVDKIVEVPRVEYVDRVVEVPVYTDVVREVKVPQYVDRPHDVIREVKVPKTRVVEKTVEVPGEIVYVDKPYNVHKEVETIHNINTEVPVIVAQTARPIISETGTKMRIEAKDYQPEIIPVDIHLAKPVDSCLQAVGVLSSHHKVTQISSAQYNTLLKRLNPGFVHDLPYVSENGRVEFVPEGSLNYVEAPKNVMIEGWMSKSSTSHTVVPPPPPSMTASGSRLAQSTTPAPTSTTHMMPSKLATAPAPAPAPPRYGEMSSSSSSVSSSINKIAYEVEQQQHKRQSMCCGGAGGRQVSQSTHLTYPPTNSSVQPPTIVVNPDSYVVSNNAAYTTTTSRPSAYPTSMHSHVSSMPPEAQKTTRRLC